MPDEIIHTEIALSEIQFDESLYPRVDGHNPAKVQDYARDIGSIEAAGAFITISAEGKLLDGKHRWLAYRTLNEENPDKIIPVKQYHSSDRVDCYRYAVRLNSQHGQQLSNKDKQQCAKDMHGMGLNNESIAAELSVATGTVSGWLSRTIKDERSKEREVVFDLWQKCYTNAEIACQLGGEQTEQKIKTLVQKFTSEESSQSADFPKDFTPPIYNVWKKQTKTNNTSHFGNTEQQWVDNLVYMYTKPAGIVVDPFAGGASTLDVCQKRGRRCYISDRKPIIAREEDIRQHDLISDAGKPAMPSLNKRWADVELVYLDPPYWIQAQGEYSDDPTDLSNMALDDFHDAMVGIIKAFASKAKNAHIAMILQPTQWKALERQYTDHIVEITRRLKLPIAMRISAPYESQQCNAQMVDWAKENRQVLVLSREIVVWRCSNGA